MQPGLPFYVPSSPLQHARTGFEKIPQNLTRTELFRYFTFSPEDRAEILQCRGNYNRIGFALLLGGVRLMGRFPLDFSLVPRSLLTHVCEQFKLEVPLFVVYPQRQPTRYEHVERLKTYLELRLFTPQDAQQLTMDVRQEVRTGTRPHELLPTIEQRLRTRGVVLPGVTILERLVNFARNTAEEELFAELAARLSTVTKARMLALLDTQPGQRLPAFQQLQRTASRPSPEAFSHEVELLGQVQFIDTVYEPLRRWGQKTGILWVWAICEDGRKVILSLSTSNRESYESCPEVLRDLGKRGMRPPVTITTDGAAGLTKVIDAMWPKSLRICCWWHKMQNLQQKGPAPAWPAFKALVVDMRDGYCQVVREVEEEPLRCVTDGYGYAASGSPVTSFHVAKARVRSVR